MEWIFKNEFHGTCAKIKISQWNELRNMYFATVDEILRANAELCGMPDCVCTPIAHGVIAHDDDLGDGYVYVIYNQDKINKTEYSSGLSALLAASPSPRENEDIARANEQEGKLLDHMMGLPTING